MHCAVAPNVLSNANVVATDMVQMEVLVEDVVPELCRRRSLQSHWVGRHVSEAQLLPKQHPQPAAQTQYMGTNHDEQHNKHQTP
jgi:hypothetical protein